MAKSDLKHALALLSLMSSAQVFATPSSNIWAPSVATCQAYLVPHLTYDTYFSRTAASPVDTGLTVGVIPSDKFQVEIGYDLLPPNAQSPWLLNGKVCFPEGTLFKEAPAFSVGMYGIGFKQDVTSYNILYAMLQKALPVGGFISIGVYHSFSEVLMINSDGKSVQSGVIIGANSPEISVNLPGLKKILLTADIQTGKNLLGAVSVGPAIYFDDSVSVATGPVFFFDKALQPGGNSVTWALELDLDIPLGF